MFAGDTNLFCSHENIKTLFQIVNSESKLAMSDSLLLQLPAMTLNSIEIKIENSVKFLGVIVDENLTWKNHIGVAEDKISKNIGVLYRASHLVDFKNLLKIYFSFIHIYILLRLVLLKLNSRKS